MVVETVVAAAARVDSAPELVFPLPLEPITRLPLALVEREPQLPTLRRVPILYLARLPPQVVVKVETPPAPDQH